MDIANRSLQNEWEVKSDMLSVAMDYIALLKDVEYTEWEVEDDYDLQIRDYELQDLTCGVSVDVTIGVRFDANKCQAVIDTGNFLLWNDNEIFLINDTEKLIYGE
jgi:hypothetical protein